MAIKYQSDWEDLSEYLVHFTKQEDGDGNDYKNIMSILGNRKLKALNPFGIARNKGRSDQNVACFSEIPPGLWNRLVRKRKTKYGIAFHKNFILSKSGIPVWYLWNTSEAYTVFKDMMSKANDNDPIWALTPFIEGTGDYGTFKYEFEWEREWRVLGDLDFTEDDVAFLLLPEENHSKALSFFSDAYKDNIGPAFFCPYIDPKWTREKILETLKKGTQQKRVLKEVHTENVDINENGKTSGNITRTKYL